MERIWTKPRIAEQSSPRGRHKQINPVRSKIPLASADTPAYRISNEVNTTFKPKVFVAMSGGVDSSVAAALLKSVGYRVVGVFIKGWHPSFAECPWRGDREDAMRVCARLGIPFLTFDFEDEYRRLVVDYMIGEYAAGRTPNPDVLCNKRIKFGVFLKKARDLGADYIATGHYARMRRSSEFGVRSSGEGSRGESKGEILSSKRVPFQAGDFAAGLRVFAATDTDKDQTYFLWTLTEKQLGHILFPVGGYRKSEVRELARKFNLHNADKKDSQGVCFLGKLNMREFLKSNVPARDGDVIAPGGKIIGGHFGARLYTIGQRRGFSVYQADSLRRPLYVVSKNLEANTITVVPKEMLSEEPYAARYVVLREVNWISGRMPKLDKTYGVRFRHRQPLRRASLARHGEEVRIIFAEPQGTVAAGQSLVVYDGDECLGGGEISKGISHQHLFF